MASSEKRCLYEVLGVNRDCSADEIRSAYKRLALQRHPDKLVQSGVSESEATASFQELVNAYEVLSDARERAWYDSHRTQILYSSSFASNGSSNLVPDLFPFFSNSVFSGYTDSGRGFYKVYGDLFEKIYSSELSFSKKLGTDAPRESPVMGNVESPYAQVTAFYNYWLGFMTIMDFTWADQYDVVAGPNRKSRRVMDEENKKLRKKARREFNETVRGLAEFVKKRDKRVIDMQMKRNEEVERKREEDKQRKKELEIQKAERARNFSEPEWAKIEEAEDEEDEDLEVEQRNELYCIACGKKFKTDKQWKNHEQSKKHKEKVAELREAFGEEDKEYEAKNVNGQNEEEFDDKDYEVSKENEENEEETIKNEYEATKENDRNEEETKEINGDYTGYLTADEEVNELQNQLKVNLSLQKKCGDEAISGDEEKFENNINIAKHKGPGAQFESEDDEASFLRTMVYELNSRSKVGNHRKAPSNKNQVEVDDLEFMEYNDTKGSRRYRGSRKQRGRRHEELETSISNVEEMNVQAEECNKPKKNIHVEELVSHILHEPETKIGVDMKKMDYEKNHPQDGKKKKNENSSKLKIASRGRKQKSAVEVSDNVCEKCGNEFETRNKLHKHLGDTGHATIRSQ